MQIVIKLLSLEYFSLVDANLLTSTCVSSSNSCSGVTVQNNDFTVTDLEMALASSESSSSLLLKKNQFPSGFSRFMYSSQFRTWLTWMKEIGEFMCQGKSLLCFCIVPRNAKRWNMKMHNLNVFQWSSFYGSLQRYWMSSFYASLQRYWLILKYSMIKLLLNSSW